MKPTLFAASAAIILATSATSIAGNGYFNHVGRNIGYGISDGYHAHRYCLTDGKSCSDCDSGSTPFIQQPYMQQPMMPMYDGVPNPSSHGIPQPMMPQPMMAPGYTQWVPTYQPAYQPVVPGFGYSAKPAIASPPRSFAPRW